MKFIDVHCHLDGDSYGDIPRLMQKIQSAGVQKIIAVGYDMATSRGAHYLAEEYGFCYFTAGIHPTEVNKIKDSDLYKINKLLNHPKCVAVGEIGLDYHYPDTNKEKQREIFLLQLQLAYCRELPVQIHSRDCAEDMLNLLKDNAKLLKYGALLHCYSHSTEIALELEKLGVCFSFGGTSTYSGSKKAKRTIAALKRESILTETDSPYLPPKSRAGQFPNTPESIPEILQNIADIRGVTAEEMAEIVWNNAHRLFKKML